MDYNIKNPSLINHQYATAVYDAANKGKGLAKTYSSDRNGSLSFVIPVYNGMGDTAAAKPAENGNLNNYYFDSIEVYGLSDSFNRFKYNYTLAVSGDTSKSRPLLSVSRFSCLLIELATTRAVV